MIIDIIYLVIGGVFNSLTFVLAHLLPFTLPSTFFQSIAPFFATVGYLGGILDLPVFFQCVFWLMSFELLFLGFLIVWFIFRIFSGVFSSGHADSAK